MVRVEAFSKMRAMLRPVRRLALAPGTLVLAKAGGEVDEVEKLLVGEIGLLQEVAPAQVHHGSIFSGHKVVVMAGIITELDRPTWASTRRDSAP